MTAHPARRRFEHGSFRGRVARTRARDARLERPADCAAAVPGSGGSGTAHGQAADRGDRGGLFRHHRHTHLLRRLPPDQPVLLCERSPDFARGVAYATGDNDHLLNVRAANMSALSDEPLHFQDWIRRRALDGGDASCLHDTEAGLFASRGLYGQYLRSILDYAMRETAGHAQLRLLPDEGTGRGFGRTWRLRPDLRQRPAAGGGRGGAGGGQSAAG